MSIEELVNRAYTTWAHEKGTSWTDHMRAALTEQAETHALELRAYEATVQNLEERIRQMERELAESQKRIRQLAAEHERKQALLLEAHCERVSSLQERIRELEAQRVPDELRANLIVGCDEITSLCRHLRHGGCDSSDLSGLEEGLSHAIDVASEMISMLAAATKKEGE